MGDARLIEQSIILLLGVDDRPVPSMLHLEKELFLLTKSIPDTQKIIPFRAHYKGPYSLEVKEQVEDPVYYDNAFRLNKQGISLSLNGKEEFKKISEELKASSSYNEVIVALRLIRTLYDSLTADELLLLIYDSYPEYTEKSSEYERIIQAKKTLSRNLLKKGKITEARYLELAGRSVV